VNINELNKKISSLESQISVFKTEHANCVRAVNRAFSFRDNWRDKQSLALRIPVLANKIKSLEKEIQLLKVEKEDLEKKILNNKLIEEEKRKLEEAKEKSKQEESYIKGPISLLEVD